MKGTTRPSAIKAKTRRREQDACGPYETREHAYTGDDTPYTSGDIS
jgi:hypothetical protein